jgi:hypothetical protein
MNEGLSELVWRTLAPGARVVVGQGPLQGLRGTVLGVCENGHVIVAVTLLRTQPLVELSPLEICFDDQIAEPELVKH